MYEGVLDFGEDIDPSNLPVQLARSLRQVDASSVSVEDNRVSFTGGMFRLVSRGNVLGPFGFGDLTVDSGKRQVRYRLSLRQLIASDTAGCGCALVFLLIAKAPMLPVLVFILLAWVCLVAGRLAIGIPRFEKLIRESALAAHTGNSFW